MTAPNRRNLIFGEGLNPVPLPPPAYFRNFLFLRQAPSRTEESRAVAGRLFTALEAKTAKTFSNGYYSLKPFTIAALVRTFKVRVSAAF